MLGSEGPTWAANGLVHPVLCEGGTLVPQQLPHLGQTCRSQCGRGGLVECEWCPREA